MLHLGHVPWTCFLNGASTLKKYFLPLNRSKYCLKYTVKAVHVLGGLEPGTSLLYAAFEPATSILIAICAAEREI